MVGTQRTRDSYLESSPWRSRSPRLTRFGQLSDPPREPRLWDRLNLFALDETRCAQPVHIVRDEQALEGILSEPLVLIGITIVIE